VYRIELTRSADKELKSLPAKTVGRISSKIDQLAINPRPEGSKKLKGEDLWRIRIGGYRVVYFIEEVVRVVEIVRIRHRSDVYLK
jgi:mRNA interferase RelE/StbE